LNRRTRRLLLASVFAAPAALVLALYLLSPRADIGPEGYDRIQVGMSAADVEAILGGPPGNYGAFDPRVVQTRDDIDLRRLGECRYVQWVGPRHMVGVQLDAGGRVVGKDLGEVVAHGPRWRQLARWLGL
jgi:hypothetical protein